MNILAVAQDPVHIGTGGYTIGRVDNTIVRDPVTKIPKIPGTSLAGTWRYYTMLALSSFWNADDWKDRSGRKGKPLDAMLKEEKETNWVKYEGNQYAAVKCAGQDEEPGSTLDQAGKNDKGHCGKCLVCRTFGFAKKDKAQRGMAYFSDLNIVFFPVYTSYGPRWVTSPSLCRAAGLDDVEEPEDGKVLVSGPTGGQKSINLNWLNFEARPWQKDLSKTNVFHDLLNGEKLLPEDFFKNIVIVPDDLVSQIINANLETRTSVAIDPMTGTAKDGALFTSEAIPRGTIFYGTVRIEKHPLGEPSDRKDVEDALKYSKKYFETMGIGGMVTRGFGRVKIIWSGGESNGQS